jgi:hypothetical protein
VERDADQRGWMDFVPQVATVSTLCWPWAFSLRATDPRLPEEDTGPGGDRGCRFCNIMMALPRLVTDGCFHKSRQAARRHRPGMKMPFSSLSPLARGKPRILRQGVLVGLTPALKHHSSREGFSEESAVSFSVAQDEVRTPW